MRDRWRIIAVMDDDQMDPMLLSIFQGQVAEQSAYVLEAWGGLTSPFPDRMWYSIQALLIAAANLSKLLWGGGGEREVDRRSLRDSLGVTDDSPMRPTSVRNHFEHIDERIATWWAESPNHIFIDSNVGVTIRADVPEERRFRHFDPATGVVSIWGKDINIREVAEEAQRLYPRASRAALDWPSPR